MRWNAPRAVLVALTIGLPLGACGGDVDPVAPPPPQVRTVVVSPPSATLRTAETLVMVAQVSADSGADRSVTWSSADPRRVSISANGIVTAVSEGLAVVTATSTAHPEISGSATITVLPAPAVRSIALTPSAVTIRIGQNVQIVANVLADSGADRTVTWSSVDPSRVSISSNGVATALVDGIAVITATSRARPEITASATITVIPAATVKSIGVSPPSAELSIGQQLPLVVSVVADDGVSRAVTFTSSDPTIATVSPSGVVTAVAKGSAAITVAAVADTRVAATVPVTVKPPIPPQVSIQTINQGSTGLPVNMANVWGQVDVTLNAVPGQDPLASVELVVHANGRDTVVASQTFGASSGSLGAPPPPRSSTATQALAAAAIILSFRTEVFNPTTGAVAFRNGDATLRAVARSVAPQPGQQQTASSSVAVKLNNRDGFYVGIAASSSTGIATATDAAGLTWTQAGKGLIVTTVPVMYSGHTVSVRNVSFPGVAPAGTVQSARSGISVDTVLLRNYSSPASGAAYVAGELPSISAVDETGAQLVLVGTVGSNGVGIINAQPQLVAGSVLNGIRIDNVPPPAGATFVVSTVTSNSNNWINGAYAFSSGLSGIVADAGVGLRGVNTGATSETAEATYHVAGGTLTDTAVVKTGSELPASDTHLAYRVAARYGDRLGNARTVVMSGLAPHPLLTFGVDLQAPAARYLTTAPAGQAAISRGADSVYTVLNASGSPFVYGVEANDDRSGFGGSPVSVGLSRLTQPNLPGTNSGTTTCVLGVAADGACTWVTAAFNGLLLDGFRQHTTPLDAGTMVEGYYTYSAFVRDQAGNASPIVRKSVLYDQGTGASAPQVATIGFPALMRGGQPVAFEPVAADNVELVRAGLYLQYPNLPITPALAYEGGAAGFFTIGTLFDAQLTSPISGGTGFTVPSFLRAIEITDALNAPQPYVAGTVKPTGINVVVRDGPNVTPGTLAANVAIVPAVVETPSGTPGFAALTGAHALVQWRRFAGGNSPLRFEAVGPSGQTQSPFVRVVLARLTPGVAPNAQVWRVLSEVTAATGSDNGIERVWRYDFGSQSAGSYIAIGVNADGDAIATQVVII